MSGEMQYECKAISDDLSCQVLTHNRVVWIYNRVIPHITATLFRSATEKNHILNF